MKQFLPEDLVSLLTHVDALLDKPFDLLVIGGAAASLAYGARKTTTDIDVATQLPQELQHIIDRARKETGINIPFQYVGIFEPPYSYEDRLMAITQPRLAALQVFVPERHDLTLMKTVRGFENDLQTIEEIHQSQPLLVEVLLDRFLTEMTQVTANPRVVRLNFLLLVERLFGNEEMNRLEVLTEEWSPLTFCGD